MKYTSNYNLKKPERTDFTMVLDLNDNADSIDAQMKANADGISSLEIVVNMLIKNRFTTPLQVDDTYYLSDDDNKAFFADWKFKEV